VAATAAAGSRLRLRLHGGGAQVGAGVQVAALGRDLAPRARLVAGGVAVAAAGHLRQAGSLRGPGGGAQRAPARRRRVLREHPRGGPRRRGQRLLLLLLLLLLLVPQLLVPLLLLLLPAPALARARAAGRVGAGHALAPPARCSSGTTSSR
jgi:hypothetical protein